MRLVLRFAIVGALASGALAQGVPQPSASPADKGGVSGSPRDNSEVANATMLADVVARWMGPRPTPKSRIAWADNGAFDMQMHESLNARLERVDVRVEGAYRTRTVPERMSQWMEQSRRSGGTIHICAVSDGARGVLAHITLVVSAVQSVDEWQLYQPAKGYSALVVVTPDDRLVRNVVFVRAPNPGCPPGTDAADH